MKALTEAQLKQMNRLLRKASARAEAKQFVIEGPHLIDVAIEKAADSIEYVAITEFAAARFTRLLDRCERHRITIYSVSQKLAERTSDTEESQGIFAVLKLPEPEQEVNGEIVVALDAVQDPGNVGTIIRSAAWFGVKSLLLGEGSADVYAPKVVRATQGAIFSMGLESNVDLARRLGKLRHAGWHIAAATVSKRATSLFDTTFEGPTVLLMGSEAHGLNPGLLSLADREIIIPRFGEGDSLNVAISTAIILAEATRQRVATISA